MKERPIIFSTEMVKAILEGRKTQTRRIVKSQNEAKVFEYGFDWEIKNLLAQCPYGKKGDRLWVKESWRPSSWIEGEPIGVEFKDKSTMLDKSTGFEPNYENWYEKIWINISDELSRKGIEPDKNGYYYNNVHEFLNWKSSLFMPKWLSRIKLQIHEIKIEQLKNITEEDAIKEGIIPTVKLTENKDDYIGYYATELFEDEWNKINSKRGYPFESNPWVWVIEFKKV